MKKIHVIGGGTFSPIRNHLALCAPAFGTTAHAIGQLLRESTKDYIINTTITRMGEYYSTLVTNEDVSHHIDYLIDDPDTRCIILNVAFCDYKASVDGVAGDFHGERLSTQDGNQIVLLEPAEKIISKIRQTRKDIFVVGFKTTTNATSDEQYTTALKMLKKSSLNLVVANDTVTRNNMIVAPEETRYGETTDRDAVLNELCKIVLSRLKNTFTRSTVIEAPSVAWSDSRVPDNLRVVVDHCISRGAYKPISGVTAGHFAVRLSEGSILTSKRKQDFNKLNQVGLVQVEYEGLEKVIAYGAKPSVGGQSQRVVFTEHKDLDCIVHFHCPLREDAPDAAYIGKAEQWRNECGSTQCGQATSSNLKSVGEGIQAVMLDNHGPNIVFSRDTPSELIIDFIERNFDLSDKTGGLVTI